MKNFHSKIPVVILAAGESKRMGTPKGLLDYKGKRFILSQVEKIQKMGLSKIIIVLGKSKEDYLQKAPEIKQYNIKTNPHPEKGIFSSIQIGLSGLSEDVFGVFILPVDVPCPQERVWKAMLQNMKSSEVNVVVPSYEGKKGHPVLLSLGFIRYILACKSDSRLDHEIHKQEKQQRVKIISVKDSTILLNLNTIEDWESFKVS